MRLPWRTAKPQGTEARADGNELRRRRQKVHAGLTLTLALVSLLLCGSALLFYAHHLARTGPGLLPDFLRDLGIAFVVACVVAGLIELYLFVRHRTDSLRDVIDVTMSDRITSDVWLELRDLIESRPVIRKHVLLRLELEHLKGGATGLFLLRVEHHYELHGLAKRRSKTTIAHELDYQFVNQHHDAPQFLRFAISASDGTDCCYEGAELAARYPDGRLSENVWLPPRDGPPTKVQLDRIECAYVPGSYNLYTPDFMKGLDVVVAKKPADIDVEAWIRPQGPGEALKRNGDAWSSEQLILPGQGIEIKFLRRQPPPSAGAGVNEPAAAPSRVTP